MDDMKRDPFKLCGSKIQGEKASYVVSDIIDVGGMGVVYKAIRESAGVEPDELCVKFLRPDLLSSTFQKMFRREIGLVQKIKDLHIVEVLDAGEDSNGLPFFIMELLKGRTLEQRLFDKELSKPECSRIFEQVCNAVEHAHRKGIIHLDLKPSNIFLLGEAKTLPWAKIFDFGLGKIAKQVGASTTLTQFRGTPFYCSPEHYTKKVSYRSDIYSLGCILYVMITGVVPAGTSFEFIKARPFAELPPLPSICKRRVDWSPAIDKVIIQAMEREPHLRQESVWHLYDDFQHALHDTAFNPKYHCYYVFSGYRFDPDEHLLINFRHLPSITLQELSSSELSGKALELGNEESALLTLLLQQPGRYIPSRQLINKMFLTQGMVDERYLEWTVGSLAKALQHRVGRYFNDYSRWDAMFEYSAKFLAFKSAVERIPKK